MARLGDLFLHIRNGANIKQGLDNIGYPITRIETISNRTVDRNKMGYAGITDLEKYSDFVMQDGDILMSHINSEIHLGKTALYEKEGDEIIIHGMNLLSLRPNKDLITSKYAFYYLSSQSFLRQIPNITKKSVNQASFTVSALKELVFPLMSIEKQKKITVDLDKVNDLISLRKQQLSKLDELVKSRFVELFGMPGADDFGWGLTPLGSICSINPKKGQDPRISSGVEVSFVPMPAVTERGEIDATAVKEYDEVKTGFTYFAENDVLFAKITPCMENGKGAVARGLHNGLGFGSTEFHVLRPISGKSNPYWIYTLTAFSQFRKDAASNMTGSAGQRRVPASFLENYRVAVPPIELQEKFAAFVEQTDKSKFEIQKSLEKLETLKKALMQKYFGEMK